MIVKELATGAEHRIRVVRMKKDIQKIKDKVSRIDGGKLSTEGRVALAGFIRKKKDARTEKQLLRDEYISDGITNAHIVISNLLGVTVKKYPVKQGYNAVTILNEDLPKSGVYFYGLFGNSRVLEQSKLVIIK